MRRIRVRELISCKSRYRGGRRRWRGDNARSRVALLSVVLKHSAADTLKAGRLKIISALKADLRLWAGFLARSYYIDWILVREN